MSSHTIVGVPRVPSGMLERTGLVDRLGRSPLTVIRAPGGSGKTVLMAQWASARSSAGAWVTVEGDIGSRLAFWASVIESLSDLGGNLHLPSEDGADRDALRAALLRSFRSLGMPVYLVVDDAHELRDPLVFDDMLALLRACQNLTLIVGTRTHSELEGPREALTLDIEVIDPGLLLLSIDEIERIAGDSARNIGTPAELLEASGGSPLLLRAILAGSRADAGSTAQAVIADYLRGLFRDHDDLDAFASTTAVPDDLDFTSAHHLSTLPPERVTELLRLLESDGLVMRRDSFGVTRYRYHPLVREVLRHELRRTHPDQFREASLLASADAEAAGQFISALRHAVDAEDYGRASDVCLHGGFALLRARGAAAILQTVPRRYIARLPFLAVILGLAANVRGERLRALELLALALTASRAWRRTQRAAEVAGLALVETVVLRITGRAEEAVAPARRMIAILEKAAPSDLEEIADQRAAYWYQGAVSLFRAGRLPAARLAAERARNSTSSDDAPEVLGSVSLIAAIDAARGDVRAAADTLTHIDDGIYPLEQLDGYMGSLAHLARGILALEDGDVDVARRQVEQFGVRPNLEHRQLFAALEAFTELWAGTPEVARQALDHRESAARPLARLTAQDRHLIAAARVLVHAALGEVASAHKAVRMLDRTDPVGVILHSTLLLLEQRPESVTERLNGQSEWREPRLRSAAEILTASAALLKNDEDLAASALRRFLATNAVYGTSAAIVLVPAELRPTLWEFAERIDVDSVRLDRFRAVPAPLRLGATRAALTPREAEVLDQLRSTASFAEIAANLSVSANTVKSQVRSLYRKLGVSNRDEALRAAYIQGLLFD